MNPNDLSEKLSEYSSSNEIAVVEGVTNEHIYHFCAGYVHIYEGEDYFEISFDLTLKIILKWFYRKVYWKVWSLFHREFK